VSRDSRRVNRHRRARRERQSILVVTEGRVTEIQYIQGLAQHLKASGLLVETPIARPSGQDPMRVLREATRLRDEDLGRYDSVWILVDVDEHATLDRCLQEAKAENIFVVVSNPCFEIWLLWHFKEVGSHQTTDSLRRRLRGFGQEGKSLMAGFPYPAHEAAASRAGALDRRVVCSEVGDNPSTAMPELVGVLRAPARRA
jgi:hypothetical protein